MRDRESASVLLLLILSSGQPALAGGGDRMTGRYFASRSAVIAKHGMACTSQALATQIAIDILKKGGSAVDAAIAANAALGLMEPTGCGIGGDLFAIVWDAKTHKLHGLNAGGRSPYALTLQHFRDQNLTHIPPRGPLPVTVPGCVDGWFELHKKFGRLAMSEVLAPAIRYANEGFPVSELIADYWERGVLALGEFSNFATTFAPGGKPPSTGDVFKNPDLARTYETLARNGRDAFYRGEMTTAMAAFCERNGCFLTAKDFNDHTSTWVDPVSTNYRGYDVWEMPPNNQGVAVLQMLNLLEPYDLTSMGHNSAEYLHRLIEAKKIAFEDRARFYADPDFVKTPVAALISKTYADQRRKWLNPIEARREIHPGDPKLSEGDTIYLTVADQQRNMVSLIQSNYRGFGSGLTPDGLGFVFQDRGELFSLDENHPNCYAPHKRPFHTIIPGFVTKNGKPWLSFGVMGGDMPQGHVQVLCNLIDFGMNLQEAGDAARFHHSGSTEPTDPAFPPSREPSGAPSGRRMTDGGWVALESGVGPDVARVLAQKGHDVRTEHDGFGGYQAIQYDAHRDLYIGASDFRKDGQAAGY
jgi:gamma-glutamyltranspeptidase/glutathione hydrolase